MSALAKIDHQEIGSSKMLEMAKAPECRLVISRLAVVEMHSILAMKVRSNALSPAEAADLDPPRLSASRLDGEKSNAATVSVK